MRLLTRQKEAAFASERLRHCSLPRWGWRLTFHPCTWAGQGIPCCLSPGESPLLVNEVCHISYSAHPGQAQQGNEGNQGWEGTGVRGTEPRPFSYTLRIKKTLKEPKPPSPSLRCARSLSLPLSLVAPLLSPWPQVRPRGTAASECAPMGAGQRLRDALREGCCVLAGQNSPEPCTHVSHGSFLSCSKSARFTPQSGRGRDGNTKGAAPQGVSRDEMWDQDLRDLEAVPALVPGYFRHVDTLWTYSNPKCPAF